MEKEGIYFGNTPSPQYSPAPPSYGGGSPAPHAPIGKARPQKHELFTSSNWRDLFWAILFYVHLAVYLGYFGYRAWTFYHQNNIGGSSGVGGLTIQIDYGKLAKLGTWLFACIGAASILSVLTLFIAYQHPRAFLHFSFFSWALLTFAITLPVCYKNRQEKVLVYSPGASVAFLVLAIIYYFFARKRIPLTAMILRMVIDCIAKVKTVILVPFAATIMSLLHFATVVFCIFDCIRQHQRLNGVAWSKMIAIAFSFYWSNQVLNNVCHTTIAGVFATYYFGLGAAERLRKATRLSFLRAMTYSFGSICLGSLIVAAIQTLRFILKSLARERDSLAAAIAGCFVEVVEDIAKLFNYYAYTQIAIYGKPYFEAAKDTWDLVSNRGLEVIVNDDLIGAACMFVSMAIGIAIGVIASFMTDKIIPSEFKGFIGVRHGQFSVFTGLSFGFIGFVAAHLFFTVVTCGATALFVCLAEDPATLQMANPELYSWMSQKYGNLMI